VFVTKVDLDVLNTGRPPVETKNLICESNAFFRRDIMHLLPRRTLAGGDVFGTQLLFESALKGSNFLGSILRDNSFRFLERISNAAVLITRAVTEEKLAMLWSWGILIESTF